ncbi:MAG: hypothetical protein DMF62_01365 [Acidobacteria bacterium]|nr:MAG: hypothetical protein DMF62_01365 [Acidobacteriota bacterium]
MQKWSSSREPTRTVFTGFLMFLFVSFAHGQTFYGTTDIKTFREGRDKEFRNRTESPLLDADFEKFAGLNYFPTDKAYRVPASLKRTDEAKYFLMPTSSGKPKKFRKFGILTFKLAGRHLTLGVYQADPEVLKRFPEYADLLFIPFRDNTNGSETYGGGRYIDIKTPKSDRVILDFNLSYNPNCAYGGDKYSCPIPPKENELTAAIRAGERKFEHSTH